MVAFFQTYGFWIFLIVMFLLMTRMHGGHGGHGMSGCCGMGGMDHDQQGGQRQHTGSEPKSDDRARVIHYNEDSRDYYQPYQARIRDVPVEVETEGSTEQPSAPQHIHKYG